MRQIRRMLKSFEMDYVKQYYASYLKPADAYEKLKK